MDVHLESGFYPFWFWNATLDAGEIRWQVAQMAAQGVKGFFIHSRQGLGRPYLSEAFFEMVDAAVEAAEAHGMVVHLYDEYPYPSGVAGGEVVLGNPQFHATRLVQRTYDVDGGDLRIELPRGNVLSCVAIPLVGGAPDWNASRDLRDHVGMVLAHESYNEMGLTDYNRKRYFASEPTPTLVATLPQGLRRLYVSVQATVASHKYWDHYVDVLNPDAVRHFLDLTHERYAARFGDKFGTTIRAIFVDETRPEWSATLPAAFQAATGRDLLPLLPALQDPDHPEHLAVADALQKVRYDRFCEVFETQVAAWCRDHGIAYAGEKASLRMAQLRYMDIPGCDPGHTKVGVRPDWLRTPLRRNAKSTSSAAYFYGKSGALCECYHSLGWSATLQDAKTIADGLLLAGIRYLVPHGFFYTTHSLVKHDAPPTFFYQMPFWPHFGALSDHITAIAAQFAGTYIDAEVLVVDVSSGLPSWSDPLDAYDESYEELLWALMRHHLDVHVVDTDILAEGEISEGRVAVADIAARVVIVPPRQVYQPELSAWLDAFQDAGGVVVMMDVDDALGDVIAAVTEHVSPSLSIRVGHHEAEDMVVVKRVAREGGPEADPASDPRTLWFALNLGREPLTVTLKSGSGLREVPLDAGSPPRLRLEDGHYVRDVAPFEAFMVTSAPVTPLPDPLPEIAVSLDRAVQLRPRSSNLLRLGTWQLALRDAEGTYGPSAAVQPMPLAMQLTASGLSFAPAFRHFFGHVPEMRLPEMAVRYTAKFDCDYDGPVRLVMEPGSLRGDWTLSVNGRQTIEPADLSPVDDHVRGSLGVDVTAALHLGVNTLTVDLTTDRLDGGLLNVLYLAGDFGALVDPLSIVDPVYDGRFEAYEHNLLPFYAGALDYEMTIDLPSVPEGRRVRLLLQTADPFHEACEVAINDGEPQAVLWEPRAVVVPAGQLNAGANRLRVRVYTSLIRAFEGQWFDYESHRYRDVGEGAVAS